MIKDVFSNRSLVRLRSTKVDLTFWGPHLSSFLPPGWAHPRPPRWMDVRRASASSGTALLIGLRVCKDAKTLPWPRSGSRHSSAALGRCDGLGVGILLHELKKSIKSLPYLFHLISYLFYLMDSYGLNVSQLSPRPRLLLQKPPYDHLALYFWSLAISALWSTAALEKGSGVGFSWQMRSMSRCCRSYTKTLRRPSKSHKEQQDAASIGKLSRPVRWDPVDPPKKVRATSPTRREPHPKTSDLFHTSL